MMEMDGDEDNDDDDSDLQILCWSVSVCYEKSSLFAKKNVHFLDFLDFQSESSKPEVENTPTCNCQNYILAQRSRLLVGQLGPSYDDGDNENGDVLMMPIRMAMTMVMTIRMMLSTLSEH